MLKMNKVKYYVETAKLWAKRSTCVRKQVGAVIFDTKTDRIISIGYNGTASGQCHCNELFMCKNIISKRLASFLPHPIYGNCTDIGTALVVDADEFRVLHHKFSDMYEVHAEQNAIFNMIKTGAYNTEDLAIITTLEPCINCAKAIVSLGIKHVIYLEKYDNAVSNVEDYFTMSGVENEQWEDIQSKE